MTLHEEFLKYHEANPNIYRLVDRFTQELIAKGHKRGAIAMVWERIRWEVATTTASETMFKLPNNHRAYYARLWLQNNPEHDKFFRIAELRSLGGVETDRYGVAA